MTKTPTRSNSSNSFAGEGKNVEVINAARGGATLPREYDILRKFIAPPPPRRRLDHLRDQ